MADYKLKPGQEKFQVVDGPYAGRKYQPGVTYTDIPPEEAHRFAKVVPPVTKKAKTTEVPES